MRLLLPILGLLVLPMTAAAQTQSTWSRYTGAREVQLRDVAGYVTVTPENRTDVAISITNTGQLPTPELRTSGHRLIVNGRLRGQIRSCRVRPEGGFTVETRRQGRVEGEALPHVNLRIPQDVVLAVGGAVRLRLAPAQSVHVRVDGCGDADIERVEDGADLSVSGSPDLRLYEAGSATVSIAGAGDVILGAVRSGLTASIAGAGDLVASRVDGPTSIAIQGAGDATIRDGRAEALSIAIFGPGDVTYGGTAETLDAAVFGSGDVRVAHVEGQVSRRVFGSGEIVIGR
jgi:hypothetical protein